MQMSIALQQCVDEKDHIIIDLKLYRSRSLFRNQLQKPDMSSNVNNFANTTWNATKLLPKESEISSDFQQYANQSNMINFEFEMLKNILCTLV